MTKPTGLVSERGAEQVSDAPATAETPPPTQSSQVTFTVYQGPPVDTIRRLVGSQFLVKDAFIDPYGIPTVYVAAEPPRQKFKTLLSELREHNLIAALRGSGDTLIVRVFQKPQSNPSRKRVNLAMFLITVATVFGSGIYVWTRPEVISNLFETSSIFTKAALFTIGLLAIIGLHEFGHKATTNYHKLDATLPYFIPGPPPIGTFGALISLKGPPANRDQLFDLGLSGPVVGFVVTMAVALFSKLFGPAPTPAKLTQLNGWDATFRTYPRGATCFAGEGFPAQPLILVLLSNLTGYINPNVIFDQQLFFAAQIGALLTFLNIVPAWQLDGGHISRAVFGPGGHRIATFAGLILLLLSGFWAFALLVLVMMAFSRRGFAGVEPLDDVSPVSNSRKILYILGIAMLVLTFANSPL